MVTSLLLLFSSALLAGLAVFFIPNLNIQRFKVVLSFSGAYLFSITVMHILPELFVESGDIRFAGIAVLTGFFFQMVLEYFSSGVEHGHIHIHDHELEHSQIPYSLLISICIHAFLEGTLVAHPSHSHSHGESHTLLYGLLLHKIPEAFALMSVLVFSLKSRVVAILLLVLFALASPMGLLLSHWAFDHEFMELNWFIFLFGVIAGNFLYISTTIFFETSPNHKFKANRLLVSVLGAVSAIIAEYLL
jgi:zinc transporter ZupT